MLTIRNAQMDALAWLMENRFVDLAVAQLRAHWPRECSLLNADALRIRVREAIAEAAKHGLHVQRDVLRYLNVSMALGAGFETSSSYTWAHHLLTDKTLHPSERMERLVEKTLDHLSLERLR